MSDLTHNERIYYRALLMCAASCQGGHSDAGHAAAEALHITFPIRMENLRYAAVREGFDPDELWPWWRTQKNPASVQQDEESK